MLIVHYKLAWLHVWSREIYFLKATECKIAFNEYLFFVLKDKEKMITLH